MTMTDFDAFFRKSPRRKVRLCAGRRPSIVFVVVAAAAALVFAVEVIAYVTAPLSWLPVDCGDGGGGVGVKTKCTRLLLVADPQLIGLRNEPAPILAPFTIWDSDRYLSRTFARAFRFAEPDVIVFLGDLFDEGSTATDEEFAGYVRRLDGIFGAEPYALTPHVWLPGDNDIGGEGADRVTGAKIARFERAFAQPDVIAHGRLEFHKIDRMRLRIPPPPPSRLRPDADDDDAPIIVGLSHVPLLMAPTAFVDKVLDELRPQVVFAAHTHKSMVVTARDYGARNERLVAAVAPDDGGGVREYELGAGELHEVIVPTCSYRMGTTRIGYGLAVIGPGTLRYTVLWSPSRFPQLIVHGVVGVAAVAALGVAVCRRR